MNPVEQARFNPFYKPMHKALTLQGKQPKTIDAYTCANAAWQLQRLFRSFSLRWEDVA